MHLNGKNITTVVSDFDGTILKKGEWQPSERFYEIINELLERGNLFIAASGRQYMNLHDMLKRLNKEIVYICENGCLVIYKGEVLHKETISLELARELLQDLQKLDAEADITFSTAETCYMVDKGNGFIEIMEQVVKYHVTRVGSYEQIEEEPLKIAIHFKEEISENVAEFLRRKYDNRLQVVDAGNHFLDFNPIASGKGEALKKLAGKLGFSIEECIAFGDSENDINMLQTAGVAFAMEHAKTHIKTEADYVCESVEDVVAYLLEEEKQLEEWVNTLACSTGKSPQEANQFWDRLKRDPELMEELIYYSKNRDFLCKHKVAGYTVADILVWQVDHFKAYLDRREEINRYRQDKLLYNSFDILLQMRKNPEPYLKKLQAETGTDYESKYS